MLDKAHAEGDQIYPCVVAFGRGGAREGAVFGPDDVGDVVVGGGVGGWVDLARYVVGCGRRIKRERDAHIKSSLFQFSCKKWPASRPVMRLTTLTTR